MKLKIQFRYLLQIILLIFLFIGSSAGQEIPDVNDKKTQKKDSVEQIYYLKSKYFTFKNFLDTISYGDTVLTDNFPYFNPIHAVNYPLVDKGNIGSSLMPLTGYISRCGFNIGINAYDSYNISKNELKWHINKIPFAQLFGSPSSTYTNFWVGALFSRNFKDVNLNIDYKRINNTGKYSNQDAKHTDLNFGIWKGSIDSRFNAFFNIIVNIHEELENGGVEDLHFSWDNLKITVPVKLDDAVTRLENYEFEFTGYYRLTRKGTFLGFKPYVKSEAGYQKGFYKFYDNEVGGNSLYYGGLLTDEIGLRNYIKQNTYHASLALYGMNSKGTFVAAGADYGNFGYNIESLGTENINQIKLFANTGLKFNNNLISNIEGELYIGNFTTNYNLSGAINYSTKGFGAQIGAVLKSSSPSLIQQKLYLTSRKVYSNDFENVGLSRLYAGVNIKKLGFSARVDYDNISSYIYFGDNYLPQQMKGKINLLSLNLEQKIRIWKFHFDNNIFILNSSDIVLSVPDYILRSKLYINTMLFKKVLELKTGFELSYHDVYYNYGYNAAIGNYFVQNKVKLENFRRLDYFVSARISDFLIFVRINNVLFPIEKKILYTVIDHPHDDLFFRLGVRWTFLN